VTGGIEIKNPEGHAKIGVISLRIKSEQLF